MRGPEAFELYLECYQLLLRKQCWTLVHDMKFPSDLKSVVRELWGLRLHLVEKGGYLSASDAEPKVYSSQSVEPGSDDSESTAKPRGKKRKENALPALVDTLGLCYLGLFLLRIPCSIGDVYR